MACIQTKADLKRYINSRKQKSVKNGKARGKDTERFDRSDITPSMIINFFTKKNENGNNKNKLFDDLYEIVKNGQYENRSIVPSFWRKIKGLKTMKIDNMTIFHDENNDDSEMTALTAIQAGMSFHHILGSVKTEMDLMVKHNLSPEQREQILPAGELVPGISGIGAFSAIGRDISMSQGIVLTPKKTTKNRRQAQFDVELAYAEVGLKAVKLLEDRGFVTIEMASDNDTTGKVVNHDYKNIDGESYSKAKVIDGTVIRINMDKLLNGKKFDDLTSREKVIIPKYIMGIANFRERQEVESKYKKLAANMSGATFMNRLLTPSDTTAPFTEPTPNSHSRHDVVVHKGTKDVLDRKEAGEIVIPPDLEEMFDYIYGIMEKDEVSFAEVAKSLSINDYKEMMGFAEEFDSSAATRSSDRGVSLSKTTPIAEFFDNYAAVRNLPYHLREEVKRNGRGHYMTTFLNPQTDKFFSRYVMQIPEYSIPAYENGEMSDTFNHLLAGIADQSGLTPDEILNSGKNDALDEVLSVYEAHMNQGAKSTFTMISKGFRVQDGGLKGSVWQKYDSVKAIYAVRKAIEEGKGGNATFTGTFMPKPDGTASGAVILSLQMAGKNDKNKSLYDALGLNSKTAGTIDDAYGIALNAFQDFYGESKHENTKSEMEKTFDFMLDDSNAYAPIFSGLRDLAKESSMPVMYSQGKESSIATVANNLTDKVYKHLVANNEQYENVNQVLEWIKVTDKRLYRMLKYELEQQSGLNNRNYGTLMTDERFSQSVYSAINTYMRNNVTNQMYELINDKFVKDHMSEYNKVVDDIFGEMQNVYDNNKQRITMIPPEFLFNAVREDMGGEFDINKFDADKYLSDDFIKGLKKKNKDGKTISRGVPLMKLFETVNHPDKNSTVARWEFPHAINAKVNMIHSIDFAILNEAFRRTFAEADEGTKNKALADLDLVKNGTMSIHDAISAHPTFSAAYQNHYRDSARDINAVYDIQRMLAFELVNMRGFEANSNVSSTAEKSTTDNAKKKIEELKNMDSSGKKVFGFENLEAIAVKMGTSAVPTKHKTKAQNTKKTNEKKQKNEKEVAYKIDAETAEEAYVDITKLKASKEPVVLFDTETIGDETVGKGAHSLPWQIHAINIDENGNREEKTFYFEINDEAVDPEVVAFNGYKSERTFTNMVQKKFNESGYKDNEEAYKAFSDFVGKKDMIAFRADFDAGVIKKANKKWGSPVKSVTHDLAAAIAHEERTLMGETAGSDAQWDVHNRMVLDNDKNHADYIPNKDDKRLHDAEFDTKLLSGIYDVLGTKAPTNGSTKNVQYDPTIVNETTDKTFLSGKFLKDNTDSTPNTVDPSGKTNEDYAFERKGGNTINTKKAEKAFEETNDLNNKRNSNDSKKVKEAKAEVKANEEKYLDLLLSLAKKSPLIAKFAADNKNKVKWINGFNHEYDPTNHSITTAVTPAMFDKNGEASAEAVYIVEHEIRHAQSFGFLYAFPNDPAVKIVRHAVENIDTYRKALENMSSNNYLAERFKYFMNQDYKENVMAEMVAVLGGEPEVRKEFLRILRQENNKAGLSAGIKLVKAVREIFNRIKNFDFNSKYIDQELLIGSISSILTRGDEFNQKSPDEMSDIRKLVSEVESLDSNLPASKGVTSSQNGNTKSSLEEALSYNKKADSSYVHDDPLSTFMRESNSYVADILWERLGANAEPLAKEGAKAVDKYLTENSDTYVGFRNRALDIWDNKEMQGIKTYLVPSSLKQRDVFHKISSLSLKADQAHGKRTSTEVRNMDNLMTGMTTDEKAKLNDIFALAPSFMLVKHDGIMNSLAKNSTTIAREIKRLESKSLKVDIAAAKDMANLYIDGNPTGNSYNGKLSGVPSTRVANVEQLTALYSLQKIPGSQAAIQDTYNNYNELYFDLVDKVRATEETTEKLYNETRDDKNFRGNMMLDYYDDNVEFKAASNKEMLDKAFDIDNGWKVAIPASDNGGYAILYRKGGQAQNQAGFGTNIGYGNTDVFMPKEFKPEGNMKHIVEFGKGKNKYYKAVIPTKIKKEIGLIQNPAQTIVRSYAHIQKVEDTQAIRREIVEQSGITYTIKSEKDRDLKEIERMATERGEDEPMFIKLGKDVAYTNLPDAVKRRFSIIKPKMSNVQNFQNEVHLVRNDVSPWLVGYDRAMPFKNVPMLEPVFNAVLQAISLMKIHMIIVNPAKVMLDTISTTTLLASSGVSVTTIAKGWKKNIPLMASMSELRAEQIRLSFKAHSGNKTAQRALEKVNEDLRNHPLMGAINAGVMQSLTTDIISRDYDTITGLQNNIDKIIKKFTRDKDGVPNGFSEGLMKMASMGLNVEDLFAAMADAGNNFETLKPMADEIAQMGLRIKRMKSEKDAEKYISEFFASPSSTLTKLGSIATTYPDAMSRIIYRDHLIAKTGKTEDQLTDKEISKINTEVSDFMPDYAFHPPMVLDAAGRWFVMPFVSWSARIQRVLLVLAKNNPMSFLAPTILMQAAGFDVMNTPYHILGSNYLTRDEFINNVFDDLFSLETVLPTNAVNFDIIK